MRHSISSIPKGPFLPQRRYALAFIFYGFLVLRLIHTGYSPLFSFLLALLVAALAIYALGALACNSLSIRQWFRDERLSARNMFCLLLCATLALILANVFFPLRELGSQKFW